MQLPADWAGIVPEADRGEHGRDRLDPAGEARSKNCHVVVFKIKREFDVTVLKWEELQNGTVQPGKGWTITATPQNDPFAVKQTGNDRCQRRHGGDADPWQVAIAETVKRGWTPVTPASVT